MDDREQGYTSQSVPKRCPVIPNKCWIKGTVFGIHTDNTYVILQLQETVDMDNSPNFAASQVGFQILLKSNVPVELEQHDVIEGVVSYVGDEASCTFVLLEYEKV